MAAKGLLISCLSVISNLPPLELVLDIIPICEWVTDNRTDSKVEHINDIIRASKKYPINKKW